MKISEYDQMVQYITKPKSKFSKEEKKKIVKDFYKKAEQPKSKPPIIKYIDTMNRLYGNGGSVEVPHETDPGYLDPKEFEDVKKSLQVSPMVKKDKKAPVKVVGVKDSALYKLLENPKVLGVELGHETIMEVINLIQNSGLVKKPEKKSVKIAVVEKPKEAIDHIAFLESLRS